MSRLVLALATVVGLVVAAFVAILVLLDNPEAYKERLSDTFEAQTGYGLEINGELNWQYFPPIAISMNNVAVTIPGLNIPLASLNSADLDLKVMPLLFGGNVEISGLAFDGLTINASVDANGKGNWEVSSDEPAQTVPSSTSDTPAAEANNLQIDIGGISVTNTTINYQDLSTNSDYLIELKTFATGPLGTGVTTDVEAELRIEDKAAGMIITNVLNGRFAINESLDEFLLENLRTNTRVEQPDTATLETDLVVNGTINTSNETANLSNTSVTFAGATLTLDMNVSELFGATELSGKLEAAPFNASKLLTALDADPGTMANPKALSQVSLSADIKGGLSQFALTNLNLTLDESNLSGGVEIGLGEKTSIDFGLNVDQISVSDYLAATTEATAPASQATPSEITDSEVIPVATLAGIDVNGQFSINSLTYNTWALQSLNLKVTNRNNALNVNGSAGAYQGNIGFSLDSRYPQSGTTSKTEFSVSGVDIATALDVTSITGTIELKATHDWSGAMMSDLVNSLDGDATYKIANGTLDVRAIKQLAAIVDGIQGTQSGIAEWPDLMPFESLNGDHKINRGIKDNQTFSANLENMRITGEGGIDYFANSMAFDIEAMLLANVGGQFTVNERLTGVKWPLRCAGSLSDDPVSLCLPDRSAITDLIKRMAAEEVKRRGRDAIQEKIEEAVPEELKDAAKGLLKGLFGN